MSELDVVQQEDVALFVVHPHLVPGLQLNQLVQLFFTELLSVAPRSREGPFFHRVALQTGNELEVSGMFREKRVDEVELSFVVVNGFSSLGCLQPLVLSELVLVPVSLQ